MVFFYELWPIFFRARRFGLKLNRNFVSWEVAPHLAFHQVGCMGSWPLPLDSPKWLRTVFGTDGKMGIYEVKLRGAGLVWAGHVNMLAF